MKSITLHRSLQAGALRLDYLTDQDGRIGLRLLPWCMGDHFVSPRSSVPAPGDSPRVRAIEPLVQIHLRGESLPVGFAAGRTLRRSPLSLRLSLVEQRVHEEVGSLLVV